MGYEIKLVIGQLTPAAAPESALAKHELKYGRSLIEVARLDLSKIGSGPLGTLIDEAIKDQKVRQGEGAAKVGFYAEDGDTLVTEDRYGDPVTPVLLQGILEALVQEIEASILADETPYRRFVIAQALIEKILDTFHNSASELVALTFGH